MNERASVALLALAAMVAAWALFAPKPTAPDGGYSRPLSTELRDDGLAVAANWLRANQISVRALRGRYSELDALARGDVMIIHTPMRIAMRASELKRLRQWVAHGNTLLVMAALADTPAWSGPGASVTLPTVDVASLANLQLQWSPEARHSPLVSSSPGTRYPEPLETTLVPIDRHPYFSGVHEVAALSDFPAVGWVLERHGSAKDDDEYDDEGVHLVLARTGAGERQGDGLWVVPRKDGRIVVVAVGSAFTNRAIGRADNAAFFAALVTGNLRAGGTVWFDDAHQGATSLYNPAALLRDRRLYETLAIILALWFAWVLGVQRLAVVSPPPLPDEADLVSSAAGLLDRTIPEREAVRLMLRRFVHRHAPEGIGEAAALRFDWLTESRPGAAEALGVLRRAAAAIDDGKRVRLVAVRRAIVTLEDLLR